MNESDPKLLEGLRALAAEGPREAPAQVEERLLCEMRRRSRAGRRTRWLVVAAAGIAAGVAVTAWMRPTPTQPAPVRARVEPPPVVRLATVTPSPDPVKTAPVRRAHRHGAEVAVFYRLPDIDQLAPLESARIVRVELPVSSLRLMGFAVSEEPAGSSIQADVLLGQDGLARAVRFVP